MAETRVVQKLRSGLSEYYTSFTPSAAGDKLIMAFKNELTVDDIVVKVNSSAELTYKLSLFYPSSKIYSKLADSQSSNWLLNPIGPASTMWYQMPSGFAVELEIQTYTTGAEINLFILGR